MFIVTLLSWQTSAQAGNFLGGTPSIFTTAPEPAQPTAITPTQLFSAGASTGDSNVISGTHKAPFLDSAAGNATITVKEPPAVYRFVLPELASAKKPKGKKHHTKEIKGKIKDYPYDFDLNIKGTTYPGAVTRAGQVSKIQELKQTAQAKDKATDVKVKPETADVVEFVVPANPDIYTIAIIQIKERIAKTMAGRPNAPDTKGKQKSKWGFPVLLNDTVLTEKNIAAGFLLSWPFLQGQRIPALENLKKNKDTMLLKEYEGKWKAAIETLLKKGDKTEALQGVGKDLMGEGEKIARLIYSAVQKAKQKDTVN